MSVATARVLLIEDDDLVAGAHQRLLSRYGGYEVEWVETLEDARAALAGDEGFAAIVCDLTLPDGSGAELAAWLRSARPALLRRFIAITGGSTDAAGHALISSGHVTVLIKPVDPDVLLEQVAAISRR